jgi:HTH-type transcriptional regulator/antitoxin HigA
VATASAKTVSDRYFRRVRDFPLVPIRTGKHLDEAIRVIDQLLCEDLDSSEQEYLGALSELVYSYENKHEPMPEVGEAEMLRHLIDAKGVTQAQLSRDTGVAGSTISAVLNGDRELSKRHIHIFATYFAVPPSVFLTDRKSSR